MKALGGSKITQRHHGLRNVLGEYALKAGAIVEIEPQQRFPNSLKRPDLELILGSIRYLVDVSIAHPTNSSNLGSGQITLGAALAREKKKILKYKEHAEALGAVFVPFVVESYGGLGNRAREFLKTLGVYALEHALTCSPREWASDLAHAIGCTVQRGNALIMQTGWARSSIADHHGQQ
jgi:hypothetical protein